MANNVAKENNLTDNNIADENENDTNNQSENQLEKPATLGNAIASSEEEDEPQTKNVALTGKDAENMLKKQNVPINNSNSAKKNTKKNNNPTVQNVRRNNTNQNLTQKQPENATASGTTNANTNTNTTEETANTNLEGTINNNTPTSKDTMVSLNKLTMNLLNHQIVLKLFHFQTELYGAHKASDGYLEKYANTMDKFLEIAQGIYGKITLKKYTLTGSSHSDDNIIKHLDGMITLLREKIDDVLADYTDLINVRDELVGDAEQLKYLLTFK